MKNKRTKIFIPGKKIFILYLTFLSAFAPISTDMYLPALPIISHDLSTTNELSSYTISCFLLVFAFSMIFWGPISDQYGRKKILFAGSLLYIISSIGCALSGNIWSLILWRCIQGAGSGALSTLALAIVKDVIRGPSMEKIVSIMQAFVILAPISAPVAGGFLLLYLDWRGIFWSLAICGGIAFAGALCLRETANTNQNFSLTQNFISIKKILSLRFFLYPLLLFSSLAMPFMAYLGVGTFIFQDLFDLTPQDFSLFFALIALVSLGGPVFHMFFMSKYKRVNVISFYIGMMGMGGIGLLLAGSMGPWQFTSFFFFISFFGSAIRPPSTILLLGIIKGNNGIVASLINCGGLLFGSFSMYLAALQFWPNPVIPVGIISTTICLLTLACWILIKNAYGKDNDM